MSEVVHLVAKHPATKKFATLVTPLEQVATACQSRWSSRPRSTFHLGLVTCEACKLFIVAHKLEGVWWKAAA